MKALKITPRQYEELKELAKGEDTREVKLPENISLYFNASDRILFVDTPFIRTEHAGIRVDDMGYIFIVDDEGATKGRMTFIVEE